jgi:hypothetical protein
MTESGEAVRQALIVDQILGRIADEEHLERGAPPAGPEPIADPSSEAAAFGEPDSIGGWESRGRLGTTGRRGGGNAEQQEP